MAKYITVARFKLRDRDGKPYHLPRGSEIELSDDTGKKYARLGLVLAPPASQKSPPAPAAPSAPKDPAERMTRINEAIEQLDPGKAEHFSPSSGKPHVKAIEDSLGWGISAEERDTAWAAIEEGRKKAAASGEGDNGGNGGEGSLV